MKQATVESVVGAYWRTIELSVMELPEDAKVKVDGLCDAIRDCLILMLSDERRESDE